MRSWDTTKTRHGSASGWQLHKQLGEDPCDACWLAKSEYDKRRKSSSYLTLYGRLHAIAQGRANTAMRHLHPKEYKRFYDIENEKLKIERAGELEAARQRDREKK